jgi:hypothetical protein
MLHSLAHAHAHVLEPEWLHVHVSATCHPPQHAQHRPRDAQGPLPTPLPMQALAPAAAAGPSAPPAPAPAGAEEEEPQPILLWQVRTPLPPCSLSTPCCPSLLPMPDPCTPWLPAPCCRKSPWAVGTASLFPGAPAPGGLDWALGQTRAQCVRCCAILETRHMPLQCGCAACRAAWTCCSCCWLRSPHRPPLPQPPGPGVRTQAQRPPRGASPPPS